MRRPIYILAILTSAFLIAELASGYMYFQRSSDKGIALAWLGNRTAKMLKKNPACVAAERLRGIPPSVARKELFSPVGTTFFQAISNLYRNEFQSLIESLSPHSVSIILLYVPTADMAHEKTRTLFGEIAAKHGLIFIDMTRAFNEWPPETTYFLPLDIHPTRLGHSLIARNLKPAITGLSHHRAQWEKISVSDIPGPWPADIDEIRQTIQDLPFRFRSNSLGFRYIGEEENGPSNQRILIAGDSFTFGTSVSDTETYPSVLKAMLPSAIIYNAGVPGTSILQQSSYIKQHVAAIRPDIIILQVNDGDIIDLMPFRQEVEPYPDPAIAKLIPLETDYLTELGKTRP